jgi:hypothetical protein
MAVMAVIDSNGYKNIVFTSGATEKITIMSPRVHGSRVKKLCFQEWGRKKSSVFGVKRMFLLSLNKHSTIHS